MIVLEVGGDYHPDVCVTHVLLECGGPTAREEARAVAPLLYQRVEVVPVEVAEAIRWTLGRMSEEGEEYRRRRDHACGECVPDGEIVVPGFRCAWHRLIRWAEGRT